LDREVFWWPSKASTTSFYDWSFNIKKHEGAGAYEGSLKELLIYIYWSSLWAKYCECSNSSYVISLHLQFYVGVPLSTSVLVCLQLLLKSAAVITKTGMRKIIYKWEKNKFRQYLIFYWEKMLGTRYTQLLVKIYCKLQNSVDLSLNNESNMWFCYF